MAGGINDNIRYAHLPVIAASPPVPARLLMSNTAFVAHLFSAANAVLWREGCARVMISTTALDSPGNSEISTAT